MREVDVIIPVSAMLPHSVDERVRILNFAFETFYGKQTNVDLQVIVVEQVLDGKEYYLPHLKENFCKVKKVRLDWPKFNKQWCTNVGIKHHARGEDVVIAESDMWCPDDYFYNAFEYLENRGLRWGFGWNRLYYTEDWERDEIYKTGQLGAHIAKNIHAPRHGYSEGGLLFFKKSSLFLDMGGGNEWIEELGGPDNDIAHRAWVATKTYCDFPQMVYHISHPARKRLKAGQRKVNIHTIRHMRNNTKAHNRFLRPLPFGDPEAPLCRYGVGADSFQRFMSCFKKEKLIS